jgi:hypothetical protein
MGPSCWRMSIYDFKRMPDAGVRDLESGTL